MYHVMMYYGGMYLDQIKIDVIKYFWKPKLLIN